MTILTARMRRRLFLGLAVTTGIIITFALVTASLWPVIDTVETGKTPEYPDVLPQYFSADPPRVFDEALASVNALDGFDLSTENRERGTLSAVHVTPLGTEHAVLVSIAPQTDFVTSVHVRSTSPSLRGDFGQNARTIRAFQTELDRRLGAVRFDPYAAAQTE